MAWRGAAWRRGAGRFGAGWLLPWTCARAAFRHEAEDDAEEVRVVEDGRADRGGAHGFELRGEDLRATQTLLNFQLPCSCSVVARSLAFAVNGLTFPST